MRYHFFISHMQAEASGDVGTMYHLFANMGINCWYVFMLIERARTTKLIHTYRRDMKASRERSQGCDATRVSKSNALIVFLTNSYLSRPFCLKELGWAIEFDKPILVVVEKRSILVLGHGTLAYESMYETRTTSGSRDG